MMFLRLTSARAERTSRTCCRALNTPAHLRSRGEDSAVASVTPRARGSPPLARRGHVLGTSVHKPARLTSARAERTGPSTPPRACRPAHLRSRGEDCLLALPRSARNGSPPLARRGPSCGGRRRGRGRLTSARAERTLHRGSVGAGASAHLRSRGEDTTPPIAPTSPAGSPPLARRGQQLLPRGAASGRLTSARAERTNFSTRTAVWMAAHLRSRGEDRRRYADICRVHGSPPLARRGRRGRVRACQRARLTSARAERTHSTGRSRSSGPAHLRSRGEDHCRDSNCRSSRGSPPLARRGHDGRVPPGLEVRLTSARAERTLAGVEDDQGQAAHLRSRGEDRIPIDTSPDSDGSPPLARRGHFLTCNVRDSLPVLDFLPGTR